MENISKIDPRLAIVDCTEPDAVWHAVSEPPFALHGVFFEAESDRYVRMPGSVAAEASRSVLGLSRMTSGGRLRFATDSPYVALRALIPAYMPMPHMPLTGSHSFVFFVDGAYRGGKVTPTPTALFEAKGEKVAISGVCRLPGGMHEIEVYFPLYGGVHSVEIGLAPGAVLNPPRPYQRKKPIVFYGSSITQGACASRAGNDATAFLCRWLDSDYLNLGFSGNGNAEPAMLAYLAGLDAGAYVFDYNYYPSAHPDRVLPPHYDIYRCLRDAHPDVPILMIDKPGCSGGYPERREMIESTLRCAIAEGDRAVAAIDAHDFFGERDRDACLVDSDHPNDLGFYRMAEVMYRTLAPLLGITD